MAKYVEKEVQVSSSEVFITAGVNKSVHMARDPKFFKDGVARCGIRGPGGMGWSRINNPSKAVCSVCYSSYVRDVASKERGTTK